MKTPSAIVLGVSFILTACADSAPKPSLTAPDVATSRDLAWTDDVTPLYSAVGPQSAVTGARATGHAQAFRPDRRAHV